MAVRVQQAVGGDGRIHRRGFDGAGEGFSDADLTPSMRSDYLNKIYPTRINTKLGANNIAAGKSKELSNLAMRFDLVGGASKVYKAWVASIEPPAPTTKTPTKPGTGKPVVKP